MLSDYWKNWTPLFPEHKHNDKLLIVGFAPTTRDAAPFEDESYDVWGMNECLSYPWFRRNPPTMMWQIHPVFDYMRKFNRNDPKHWRWLQQDHPFPIMMQNQYAEIPNSVAYPLHDAIQAFSMYFTSTPAYMLALAMLMGYKRVDVYGIEMSADSEYIYQKAAFEYLMGFARGREMEIYIPPMCSLARAALYGYEDLRAASRVYYEFRVRDLTKMKTLKEQSVWEAIGGNNMLLTLLKDEGVDTTSKRHLAEVLVEQEEKINQAYEVYGRAAGAVTEMQDLIRWHEKQSVADDREDLPNVQA